MRALSVDEAELYAELHHQITKQYRRNLTRDRFVEAEHLVDRSAWQLPDGGSPDQVPLYWPAKAIEVFSSRLRPRFFTHPSEEVLTRLQELWTGSAADVAESLAIKSSLRHGPAFVFTSLGDTDAGEPEVIVTPRSAKTATCKIDSRTRRVVAALDLLADGRANLLLPGRTLLLQRGLRPVVVDEFETPLQVQCAPFIHDADISKPFGTSRVTRSVMGFTEAAMRTFMRQEVSAEWYQNPRERLLGVESSTFTEGGWTRAPGAIDALPDIHPDDDPNVPDNLRRAEWHVFPQMSMQPFSDQFRLIASQFSGASSIPLQYLGIVQDSNPTSAKAIEAQDVDLVRAVEDQQPGYTAARRQLAANILTLTEGAEAPKMLRGLAPRWHDPRHRGVMEQGQFVAQQVQAGNLVAGSQTTLGLLPISDGEARAAAEEARRGRSQQMLAALTPAEAPRDEVDDLRARFEALGAAIAAGVSSDDAATRLGLTDLRFGES